MSAVVQLDRRNGSRMDPETKLIHQRLEAWGRWAYDSSLRAYPRETVLSKMIEYGPLGAAQASKPPVEMPDDIAQVDAAVARLGNIDRRAITAYYTREDAIDACAKKCRMSLRQFQRVLQRARFRLRLNLLAHTSLHGAQLSVKSRLG